MQFQCSNTEIRDQKIKKRFSNNLENIKSPTNKNNIPFCSITNVIPFL